jgi:hypothetical protein
VLDDVFVMWPGQGMPLLQHLSVNILSHLWWLLDVLGMDRNTGNDGQGKGDDKNSLKRKKNKS